MPDDRLLHRRCLHSATVSSLTDFEHRVWITYELASDDYGVMRFSAAALRSANDAFEQKPAGVLERAFRRLEAVGLIRVFHHQGKAYCYQPDWQSWQRIKHPRPSVQPLPPLEAIDGCDPETRAMFKTRLEFTGESYADGSLDAATVKKRSSNVAPYAHERETANGKRLEAHGSDLRSRFDEFWQAFPRKVGKGAAWRVWAKLKPDAELVAVMLQTLSWQRTQAQWLRDGGQYIPHPSTWLNQSRWEDQPPESPQFSAKTANSLQAIYGSGR